ncbi:MAG: cadmium-translocating P-type ATPase, partial [Candidatus Eremiobacteraeota bacterium]|nr:cadmium-translocating P-type ATPase [Candidatus Eremiobacteraeota bacterium]
MLRSKNLNTTRIQIHGLCCAKELAQVEKVLVNTQGVCGVRVNPVNFQAHITHDGSFDPAGQAIVALGYRWNPVSDGEAVPVATPYPLLLGLLLALAGWLAHLPYLYLASALVCGAPTLVAGGRSLARFGFDMNALTSLAAVGAVALGDWAEACAIMFLFSLAQWLEKKASARTQTATRELLKLHPAQARRLDDQMVPIEQVEVGQELKVLAGERIPLDSVVVSGQSSVDQSSLTGESRPLEVGPGSSLYGGTVNQTGGLVIRVERSQNESTLARIIQMVEEAQSRKAPLQRSIDRFAAVYTPVVLLAATALAFYTRQLGAADAEAIYRGLTLLVLACPCALVISTPVALVTALGQASRHGVLVKSGAALELVARLRGLALDKTGTLTHGRLAVTSVETSGDWTEQEVLCRAAAVESFSEHPIAQAIRERARGLEVPPASDFLAHPGRGAEAEVAGLRLRVGKPSFFEDAQPEAGPDTLVLVGTPTRVEGVIRLADTVRCEAKRVLHQLNHQGIEQVVMLTGDHHGAALQVAEQVGLKELRADLLPGQKLEHIRELQQRLGNTAMVGDGINDAPALAQADVGVAMGLAGTDVAIETAQVALMQDDLGRLVYVRGLASRTMQI